MTTTRSAWFAALVCSMACASPSVLTAGERAAGAAALAGWRAAGLPEPYEGCNVSRFQVRLADEAMFLRVCRASPVASAGCLSWEENGSPFRPTRYPVVVISPGRVSEPRIIVHELMHAAWHCSNLPGSYSPANTQHLDPRVWTAAGGETSAQSRAMRLLEQP
jgi:hypothetical protein